MDQEKINKLLTQEEPSEFETKLKTELMDYIRSSSDKMSEYWPIWERAQDNYRGYKPKDKEDEKSAAKGEPTKILIPVTFAQIQTATAFIYSTFAQRDKFFELKGTGAEDVKISDALEHDLNYQVNKTKLLSKLFLFILDTLKFGIGVLKLSWEEQKCFMRVGKRVEQLSLLDGIGKLFGKPANPTISFEEVVEEVLKYEGNVVTNISPFCFYPDPALPVARFQDGAFVANEELVNKDKLRSGEGKIYFGTKHIQPLKKDSPLDERKRWHNSEPSGDTASTSASKIDRNSVIYTEIQFSITPKDWTEKFDLDFGDEDYPVKHIAVIANDQKIIRFERLNYLHGEFTYVVAEYMPDINEHVSFGLSDAINELQNMLTWFFNSHVANVKKVIRNQVVADPSKIHTEDLINGETVIRVKSGPGTKIDESFKQLQVSDATAGHVKDAESIFSTIQTVTGVNDNALGNYSSGRRSAYEARQVNAGAAMRLKMHASLIWSNAIEPLGQQLLANTRQSRTKATYEQIVGPVKALNAPFEETILADPERIAGGYDFLPYDGTLPSEKNSQAQILNELLTQVLANPMNAQVLGIDAKKLLSRISELTGIKDLDNVMMAPTPLAPSPMPVPGDVPPQQAPTEAPQQDVGAQSTPQQMLAAMQGNA